MIALARRLLLQDRGTATIELALIAPVLASMIIGVIDMTTAFNRKLELEQGVQRAIERVMQTTGDKTPEDTIKDEVAEAAGVEEDQVVVTYTLTCSGTATPFDQQCAPGQAEVRYMNVVATDTFTPMIPLAALGMQKDHMTLTVESGVRTK